MVPSPRLSEITNCPDCSVELEVISLEPLKIAAAPEIEEDWGE
jgi:alpha-aminoadipate carrier protein LysW